MTGMGTPPGPGDSSIVAEFHHQLAVQLAIVLAVVAVLFILWNQLRAMQYRRAVARGEPFAPGADRPAPEAPGRRFLRIAFGLLWLFDGLLQLQSGMPTGLPSQVIRPAAATSPSWVRHLVDSALTLWNNHPAAAAASTVWIQVGIGLLLLVAPRGFWSRGAGVVSVVWGLIVWSVGNAFGGILAPGLTLLFGAPGAIVFYIVAGVLVALPDRAWAGRRMGRFTLGGMGVLLIGFGVLQAWPGRGFWQGGLRVHPGTLTAMIDQMAQTSQPHALASLVSSFASFDGSHGWGVNLVAVLAMLVVGVLLLMAAVRTGDAGDTPVPQGVVRFLRAAMVALVVFCLADWILIEDLGFLGGTGTDPNSMLPLLFLTSGGYLALMRPARVESDVESGGRDDAVSAPDSGHGPEPVVESVVVPDVEPDIEPELVGAGVGAGVVRATGAPAPVPAPPPERSWWEGVDSKRAGRLAATAGAIVILMVGVAPMAAAAVQRSADPQIALATDGAPTVTSGPAPGFSLTAPDGSPVSLADLRGETVVLTFLDPVCTTDCPIIAQELRVASDLLGGDAAKVRFVAVVANPIYRSVQYVADFNRQEGLDSQSNWLFLTGSLDALQKVWNDYGVTVQSAPAGGMIAHSDVVYIIDPHGQIRRILNSDPGSADSSVESSFSGLVASEVTQVQQQ